MLFWGNDSLQFVLVSLEEVTFIASGKCPMLLLSCLVCAITGWLKHSPLLSGEKDSISILSECACVSSLYGQTGSCSPQKPLLTMDPESRCLWKHDCDRKCSTCLTMLQLSKRWGCFREEPSLNWGLLLMLAARPSGGCPESTTQW